MVAYHCLNCDCVHGFCDHPQVTRVEQYTHAAGREEVWCCPRCGREHRALDGTVYGRLRRYFEMVEIKVPAARKHAHFVAGMAFIVKN